MGVGSSHSTGATSSRIADFAEREMVARFVEKSAEHAAHIGFRDGDLQKAVRLFTMDLQRFIPEEVLLRTVLGEDPPSEKPDTPKGPGPLSETSKTRPLWDTRG